MAEILEKKDIEPLENRLTIMELILREIENKVIPSQEWFTRREVCALKNINYNTVKNKKEIWPKGEKVIGGLKQYPWHEVMIWRKKSDKQLEEEYKA